MYMSLHLNPKRKLGPSWRNIICHPLYQKSKKKWYKWTYLQNKNRLTDFEKKLMVARREGWREGIVRELEINMHTLLYWIWITNKVLLYSTLLNVIWQSRWKGNLRENGCMYTSAWVPLLSTWNYHNTGNKLFLHAQSLKWSESEVAQSCPTLRDPRDCSPPGSSVHRIFQARVLE